MSAFGGLTSIARQVEETTAAVHRLGAAFTATAPELEKTRQGLVSVSSAAEELHTAIEAVSAGGAGGRGGEARSREAEALARLESLEQRIKSTLGEDNFFAATIARRIESVRSGEQSLEDALEFLRQFFAAYEGGLFQDATSSNAALRALANELERFIHGGALQ